MPVPDYETIMLPLLKLVADGQEHSRLEITKRLAKVFNLTDEEFNLLLPSGQPVFYNRVGWAQTYLKKAGILASPRRLFVKITPRGVGVLEDNPIAINSDFLMKFPEFVEFKQRPAKPSVDGHGDHASLEVAPTSKKQTPEEALEDAYLEVSKTLAIDLIEQVKSCPPSFFEKLVVHLLVSMGYGGSIRDAGQAIGGTGDGGIDGIIKQDPLGLDFVYIQAKRWQGVVGSPEIQKFVGALQGQKATKGVFITTSAFSARALEYAARISSKLVLIDGERLAQLMIDYGIGVSRSNVYEVKKIDQGYFSDE